LRVWLVVLLGSVGVAICTLPLVQIVAGLGLTMAVVMYVVSHQFLHRTHRGRVPKEICIAVLLTGGIVVFLIGRFGIRAAALPLTFFAGACFTNCAVISWWERDVIAYTGNRRWL
jgi:hypothetical protein